MHSRSIVWLPEARDEKDRIIDHIAEHNALAALDVDDQIHRLVSQLAQFPYLGRIGRIAETFELIISNTPYIVAYRLLQHEVQILHIFHERRHWPPQQDSG